MRSAGLYNRFIDYQRVVKKEGSEYSSRYTEYCPCSHSRRFETIREAEAYWVESGLSLPLPRRFR